VRSISFKEEDKQCRKRSLRHNLSSSMNQNGDDDVVLYLDDLSIFQYRRPQIKVIGGSRTYSKQRETKKTPWTTCVQSRHWRDRWEREIQILQAFSIKSHGVK